MEWALTQPRHLHIDLPVRVLVDNVGAIYIANNAVTKRTKHIDTRYHMIHEHVEDGIVKIIFVKSNNNLADPFTKTVDEANMKRNYKYLSSMDKLCSDM